MDPVEAITTEVLDEKDAKSKSTDGVATVITSGAYTPASTDAEADNNAALVVEEQSHKDPTEEHSYTTEETDDYVATVITKTIIQMLLRLLPMQISILTQARMQPMLMPSL